jgi:DNA modification methylase
VPTKTIDGGLTRKTDVYIGIDQSLTGFALTALSEDDPLEFFTWVYKSPYFGIERLVDIKEWLEDTLDYIQEQGAELLDVSIEGSVLQSPAALKLGELAAIVKLSLYERYFWYKKSGLPTGGEKRLNDKVEYIFHFTKSKKHKAYTDRIRIPYSEVTINRMKTPIGVNDTINSDGKTEANVKIVKPNELGKKPDGVFRFNTAGVLKGKTAGLHPAAFHPDLPFLFITWLTDENDVVLDPFMGTGTTAQIAKRLKRNYIGFELNESYKEIQDMKLTDEEVSKVKLSNVKDLFSDTIDEIDE